MHNSLSAVLLISVLNIAAVTRRRGGGVVCWLGVTARCAGKVTRVITPLD